jgi:hypothetical protein
MPNCTKHRLRKKLKENDFYCVGCCKRVSCAPDDIKFVQISNYKAIGGKVPALKCYCKGCQGNLTKFVKRKDADKLKKKYA